MSIHALKLVEPLAQPQPQVVQFRSRRARPRLGRLLCQAGKLRPADLVRALVLQSRRNVPLGKILVSNGLATESDVLAALSIQFNARVIGAESSPPDPDLMTKIDPVICSKYSCLPYRRDGDTLEIVTSCPEQFRRIEPLLELPFKKIRLCIATEHSINTWLAQHCRETLSARADILCPAEFSCRSWARSLRRPRLAAIILAFIAAGITFPQASIWILYSWAILVLLTTSALRITALVQKLKPEHPDKNDPQNMARTQKLPTVSILVPLYREEKVLPDLIARLATTHYPKELLDICLILEENDTHTRQAVEKTNLPNWMRCVIVPPSGVKTKPRAMNYALDFCHGEIIGIYDAEDAPEPDQINKIAAKFSVSGPEIACIQAYLDYYNPKENWISRCFTIEYAIWFRLVLQGIQRLGLPVPLGGTSVFFRRETLVKLGAWDVHNVTEDADLGIRLARMGYRCAFEATTTFEEANYRLYPWIKQRSRWLKGYAMTWITHVRAPRKLLGELGLAGFITFHVLLFGTLSTFLLAPAVWSFWLIAIGLTPGFAAYLPASAWTFMGTLFLCSEIILLIIGLTATAGKEHRYLWPWVPTMILYWPLGTLAAFKAMYELLTSPFYWDKTQHGLSPATDTLQIHSTARP